MIAATVSIIYAKSVILCVSRSRRIFQGENYLFRIITVSFFLFFADYVLRLSFDLH